MIKANAFIMAHSDSDLIALLETGRLFSFPLCVAEMDLVVTFIKGIR